MNNFLKERIIGFQNKVNAQGIAFTDSDIAQLDEMYSQSHRVYHGWKHIECCLRRFESVEEMFEEPLSILAAMFYHDAIFELNSPTNEAESAQLAYEVFKSNEEFAQRVKLLIEDTEYSGEQRLFDNDADLMKDIDFSSFTKPFDEFWQDVIDLIEEDPDKSKEKRIDFYRVILSGEFKLFRTEHFKETYSDQVKVNLLQGIEKLQQMD